MVIKSLESYISRRSLLTIGASLFLIEPIITKKGYAAENVQTFLSDTNDSEFVNIRDFGAKGDGVTIDSPAINAAIDYVSSKGGGTILIPPGTFASYTIRLKSNIRLHLSEGAVLCAAPTPITGLKNGGYDNPDPIDPTIVNFQDFGHSTWRNSLIWGEGLHDIAITGSGLIWGKGLSRGLNWTKTPPEQYKDQPISGKPGVGEKSIALKNCRNVLMRDFKILEGGWFALLLTGVDNLTIDNLLIDTNRDGMDIDCCKNVKITNCTVNSPHDDGICPKSSYALGYLRLTENVLISNCIVSGSYRIGSVLDGSFVYENFAPRGSHGRIKLGTESNGGFVNITITNCVFDRCRGIALETVDGGRLEDITISNITMRGITTSPIFLRLGRRMRGPKEAKIGTLKRILITNITSSGADQMPTIIAGVEGYPVEDVIMNNVFLQQMGGGDEAMKGINPPTNETGYPEPNMFGPLPASGLFIRHAKNINLSHVQIETISPDHRPAFWLEAVDSFNARALTIPKPLKKCYNFDLHKVSNFRISDTKDVRNRAIDYTPYSQF